MNRQHNCSINNSGCTPKGQWWFLNNYFGISGCFCSHHFSMVAHDPYGKPNNQRTYMRIKNLINKGNKS